MSGQSWHIAVVFLIVLQQISPNFGATMLPPGIPSNAKDQLQGCRTRERFFAQITVDNSRNKTLSTIHLQCTTETIFEVRYANEVLCRCGRIVRPGRVLTEACLNRLQLDFWVIISAANVHNQFGENCTFGFLFIDSVPLILELGIKPGKIVTSTLVVSGVSTRFYTSYITSTNFLTSTTSLIGQQSTITSPIGLPSTTSSFVVANSTTRLAGQISSTVVELQPSQSFVSASTGIVITPSIQESPASKPQLMTSSLTGSIVPVTSIQASGTSRLFSSSRLSPDEEKMKKLKQDIEFINNVNTSAVKISDENTIDHVLDAAANLINTNLTTEDQKEDPGMQAVEVLQDLGNSISQQLELGNNKSVTFERVTEDVVFGVAVINTTTLPGFTFPSNEIKSTGDERINIPSSVFVSDKSYFVGIIFNAFREMRNNTGDLNMGTKVINAVVSPGPSDKLEQPVEMTFEKNIVGPTLAQQCSFWLENSTLSGEHGRWSTRECFKTFESESHIKCECSHFTNFAVLFKVSKQPLQEEHSFRLVIITYVGLGLSILGCLLTFIIYVTLSNIKSDRATIHKNLVFALGIADVIFLVTVAVKPDGDSCTAMTMLAFFFYLAVFFWMLVEGVYIYLMVIKVFRGNVARRRRVAYIVGWGCPVVIALATWAILRHDVVSKYHCWLSVETGAIWAFVGPGLAIILTNCIILVAVMRTTWATFVDDKEYGGLKSATKTFGAVIPILGITWIFGVMAFNDSAIVFQYIFAIVNSLQGALIFILYCIVNNEVRNEINRRIVVWQTRREMSSLSGTGGQRATYPYIISSEKNTTFNRTTASAQETPDLYRYPLSEMKDVPPSEKVEKRYSFETPGKTFKNESEFGVKDKDGSQDTESDKESGQSRSVELDQDSRDKDLCEDSIGYV